MLYIYNYTCTYIYISALKKMKCKGIKKIKKKNKIHTPSFLQKMHGE